jgi:hypothetical protein
MGAPAETEPKVYNRSPALSPGIQAISAPLSPFAAMSGSGQIGVFGCGIIDSPRRTAKRQEAQMSTLFFRCPKTRNELDSRIELDPNSVIAILTHKVQIACPHCEETHEYHVRDGYLKSPPAPQSVPAESPRA